MNKDKIDLLCIKCGKIGEHKLAGKLVDEEDLKSYPDRYNEQSRRSFLVTCMGCGDTYSVDKKLVTVGGVGNPIGDLYNAMEVMREQESPLYNQYREDLKKSPDNNLNKKSKKI